MTGPIPRQSGKKVSCALVPRWRGIVCHNIDSTRNLHDQPSFEFGPKKCPLKFKPTSLRRPFSTELSLDVWLHWKASLRSWLKV